MVLREGGNAVDAAVGAALASFAAESPLTGLGAGGFMLIHDPSRPERAPAGGDEPPRDVLVDFFVAAPGMGGVERRSELVAVPVHFGDAVQTFNIGAASCGVPGNAAGLEHVARRWGSMPLADLAAPAVALAREGAVLTEAHAFLHQILSPILAFTPEAAAAHQPAGRPARTGERVPMPELAEALERFGAEGSRPFYEGEVGEAICEWVAERGGTLSREDLAAYEPVEREPVRAGFRGTEVVTNPPPSSGGILIAFALGVLERLGDHAGAVETVAATEAANALRDESFDAGLHDPERVRNMLDPAGADAAAERIASGRWSAGASPAELRRGGGPTSPSGRLGSTTHLSVMDAEGMCASLTCSNGTGSGLVVPGTGVHVNNMLGEEDLNPHGFHRIPPGRRVSSMMAPTHALRDGEIVLGTGSAGSNRIRSAILQTVVRVLEGGMSAAEAIAAPRVHYEAGTVQAEPGADAGALDALEAAGIPVVRWRGRNLYFGGVQGVTREPGTGVLDGGGDPRRGGVVVTA